MKKRRFSSNEMYKLLIDSGLNYIPFPGIEVIEACKVTRIRIFGDSSYINYNSCLSKLIWLYPIMSRDQWLNIYRMLASWDGEMEALAIMTTNRIYDRYTRRHRRTLGRFRYRTCSGVLRRSRRAYSTYSRQEKKIRIQRLVSKNKQIDREM